MNTNLLWQPKHSLQVRAPLWVPWNHEGCYLSCPKMQCSVRELLNVCSSEQFEELLLILFTCFCKDRKNTNFSVCVTYLKDKTLRNRDCFSSTSLTDDIWHSKFLVTVSLSPVPDDILVIWDFLSLYLCNFFFKFLSS